MRYHYEGMRHGFGYVYVVFDLLNQREVAECKWEGDAAFITDALEEQWQKHKAELSARNA